MTDATAITELDDRTVERIAAGEVVERPASVVKELVENAIDAGADRVHVAVDAGGTERIEVRDDGVGMTADALRQAVREHTTSKIADVADLEAGVGTLGFRGEALHAIGAVSRTTITTRPRDPDAGEGEGTATELHLEGGEVTDVSPAGRPPGTTVAVTDLFYNVPARRKYLKTEATEFDHVNRIVASYALAAPDVAVSLEHDGREVFATTGGGDRREAVMAVYGREVAASMVPVDAAAGRTDAEDDQTDTADNWTDTADNRNDAKDDRTDAEGGRTDLPDGPLDGVAGLVSHPETNRASREYLSTFVNGRYVTAGAVREAIVDAYDAQLGPDRYPFAVVDLDLDPGTVDVNVHPRKLEVRFADESAVRDQVETAVRAALAREGLVRTRAPRGRSAPDEAAVEPATRRDADETAGSSTEPEAGGTGGTARDTRSTPGTRPDSVAGESDATAANESADAPTGESGASAPGAPGAPSSPGGNTPPGGKTPRGGHDQPGGRSERSDDSTRDVGTHEVDSHDVETRDAGTRDTGPSAAGAGHGPDRRKFDGDAVQAGLGGAEGPAERSVAFETLPAMRLLGQFRDTYLVAETGDGLVLVDQHAADERINYERLRESMAGAVTTQALAQPVAVPLTAGEAAVADTHREALASLGFRLGPVEDGAVEVRTVPDLVGDTADPTLLRDVLAEILADAGEAVSTVEAAADDLLADLACYPSVTANTSLAEGSALALLERLDDCENPWACPHGRPTVIVLEDEEIEGRFERDYPGH